jgi:hypothetical protein
MQEIFQEPSFLGYWKFREPRLPLPPIVFYFLRKNKKETRAISDNAATSRNLFRIIWRNRFLTPFRIIRISYNLIPDNRAALIYT